MAEDLGSLDPDSEDKDPATDAALLRVSEAEDRVAVGVGGGVPLRLADDLPGLVDGLGLDTFQRLDCKIGTKLLFPRRQRSLCKYVPRRNIKQTLSTNPNKRLFANLLYPSFTRRDFVRSQPERKDQGMMK